MKIDPVNLNLVRPSTAKAAKAFYEELRDEVAELLEDDNITPLMMKNHLKLMELLYPVAFSENE